MGLLLHKAQRGNLRPQEEGKVGREARRVFQASCHNPTSMRLWEEVRGRSNSSAAHTGGTKARKRQGCGARQAWGDGLWGEDPRRGRGTSLNSSGWVCLGVRLPATSSSPGP